MGESAEDLPPADPVLSEADRFGWPGAGLGRAELAEGTVRPSRIVVPQVFGQHLAKVTLIDDQQPVEDPRRKVPMIADRVRSGCLRRADQNPDAFRGENGIEGAG